MAEAETTGVKTVDYHRNSLPELSVAQLLKALLTGTRHLEDGGSNPPDLCKQEHYLLTCGLSMSEKV